MNGDPNGERESSQRSNCLPDVFLRFSKWRVESDASIPFNNSKQAPIHSQEERVENGFSLVDTWITC